MKGYYENDEANKESFDGDWFRTGDVVTYDEEGFFYIVDRNKDMIKVKERAQRSSLDMLRALQWIGEAMIFLEINSFGIESI